MNKLFRKKELRYRNLALVILPFLIAIVACVGLIYKSLASFSSGTTTSATTPVEESSSAEKMGYYLRANATDLQISLYEELEALLEAEEEDSEAIALSICKNYVADFYTWSNKKGIYDIGGLTYVYATIKPNMYNQARDGFYHYLNHYINQYGSDNLLEVISVDGEVWALKEGFKYQLDEDTTFEDSYMISLTWEYKDSSVFDNSEYARAQYFTVVRNEDGRYEIMEAYKGQ